MLWQIRICLVELIMRRSASRNIDPARKKSIPLGAFLSEISRAVDRVCVCPASREKSYSRPLIERRFPKSTADCH